MRLNVEMTEALYRDVSAQADADDRSMSDVVRALLREWLELRWAQRRAREAEKIGPDEDGEKGVLLG